MRLIVGLGNPGARYERNRHNIGFMAVDAIVHRHSFPPFRPRFKGEFAEGTIAGEKVMLLKPQTYHERQSASWFLPRRGSTRSSPARWRCSTTSSISPRARSG